MGLNSCFFPVKLHISVLSKNSILDGQKAKPKTNKTPENWRNGWAQSHSSSRGIKDRVRRKGKQQPISFEMERGWVLLPRGPNKNIWRVIPQSLFINGPFINIHMGTKSILCFQENIGPPLCLFRKSTVSC